MLGNTQGELDDAAFLVSQRVRIALQGHTPFAAATQAIHDTLKALREGTKPKELKGLPSAATHRPPDARCRGQGARRRISRVEERMSGAILQVTVRGRVQGVGYRAWLEDRAVACDLEGWVRNRRDGSVEALFAGPPAW